MDHRLEARMDFESEHFWLRGRIDPEPFVARGRVERAPSHLAHVQPPSAVSHSFIVSFPQKAPMNLDMRSAELAVYRTTVEGW